MKHVDLFIRAYEEATDLEKLSTIWFDASLRAHSFIGERRLKEQRLAVETIYLPKAETWVACHRQEPVGFISLLGSFIGGLFVAPEQQGLGVGRALVSHALGLKGELCLEVYTGNTQAVGFYQSLGFEEISRRAQDDEGLPFENARMRLTA
ncbi:GNAT family N-acetyltransferase [Mycoplana ramosa]|uniref:GNAT family N-acetyltransferase n=1 Tax=Mycoplana ramosa TaxID=40837 RepID=A0ABW3YVK0_MYCRA